MLDKNYLIDLPKDIFSGRGDSVSFLCRNIKYYASNLMNELLVCIIKFNNCKHKSIANIKSFILRAFINNRKPKSLQNGIPIYLNLLSK